MSQNARLIIGPGPRRKAGFNATCLQIRLGYLYFTGRLPLGSQTYADAAADLIKEYGRQRVETVIKAIPNNPDATEADAYHAARQADPGLAAD